jgi:hypothetical protein
VLILSIFVKSFAAGEKFLLLPLLFPQLSRRNSFANFPLQELEMSQEPKTVEEAILLLS